MNFKTGEILVSLHSTTGWVKAENKRYVYSIDKNQTVLVLDQLENENYIRVLINNDIIEIGYYKFCLTFARVEDFADEV